jgi:serine phosphatase RsbU (regulator of sigma subunit)/CheY-like chemotaxis protein
VERWLAGTKELILSECGIKDLGNVTDRCMLAKKVEPRLLTGAQRVETRMKILLVEDNPADRMYLTHTLRAVDGFDHELVPCESLADALERLISSDFDVVLLDLMLPDSEGLETCHRVVAAVRNVPVVVMTGTNDREMATEAIRCGAQDYLIKGGFPGSAIARVLQYAIDRHHFQRELVQRDNQLREVCRHVPAIIWTTNRELKITSAVGAGLQLLSLDPRQIVGKTLEEYFQIDGVASGIVKAHKRALEREAVSLETEWMGRLFEIKIDPLHEQEHNVAGTIGVALDVTERRSLDREINFARLVQEALLPAEHPSLERFEIFGGSHPARQTCGDWFDYLNFPDGSLGLVVGDVCGKGFGPAILSATIAAYMEVLAETHSGVSEILDFCNRLVCRRALEGQFAVLTLARLQPGTMSVTFGGAGDGMLIVGGDGRLKRRVASSGLPIGLIDPTCYKNCAQVPLDPGDILLLLTDGFREAFDSTEQMFGEASIVQTVAAHVQDSASEIFQSLWRAVRQFGGDQPQSDDMTGIVVKVLDP